MGRYVLIGRVGRVHWNWRIEYGQQGVRRAQADLPLTLGEFMEPEMKAVARRQILTCTARE